MRADKSWQRDQSAVRPDQNHTTDTVVVYPDRLTKCGETDFRQYPGSLRSTWYVFLVYYCLSVISNALVQNMKQLKTRTILCFFRTPFIAFSISHCMSGLKKKIFLSKFP